MKIPRVRAPELPQNYPWLNTEKPISLKQLKGQIILLDFWTYCCINCLHILPDLKYLEQKYKNQLTVIGIHSAKFENEQEVESIRQAILRYNIGHPVLVDSGFYIWQQYAVRAWPTLVLIDPEGYVISHVAGEGHREVLDELIQQLIHQHQQKGTITLQELNLTLEKQRNPIMSPLAFPGKVLATNTRLFIADSGHHRLIVSTLNGKVIHLIGCGQPGLKDAAFSEAEFFAPQGMALDEEKQILYVADTENHTVRQIDLQQQVVKTIAGTGTQNRSLRPQSGSALETSLNSPWDLQRVGYNLYIAMAGSHQIWQLDLKTSYIRTYAGTGAEAAIDGTLIESAFAQPSGITTDGQELYIADSEASSIRGIKFIEPQTVRTVCGSGNLFDFGDADGQGFDVRLQHCLGVEYAQNILWVADTYNHKIKRVDPYTGDCQTILGDGCAGFLNEKGQNSRFSEPSGLSATDSHLYVADTNNHAIRRIDLKTLAVTTLQFPGLCTPEVCFPQL